MRTLPSEHRSTRIASPSLPIRIELSPPELRSDRLILRPLAATDRQAFIRVVRASRSHLDRFAPLHRPGESDRALFERQLQLTRDGDRTGKAFRRVAILPDGTLAGAFNLNAISRGLESRADVNFWVAANLAGQGIATEGLRALVDYATADLPAGLGLHLIEAGIRRGNVASARVVEKAGFTRRVERTHICTGEDWVLHDLYAFWLRPAA